MMINGDIEVGKKSVGPKVVDPKVVDPKGGRRVNCNLKKNIHFKMTILGKGEGTKGWLGG